MTEQIIRTFRSTPAIEKFLEDIPYGKRGEFIKTCIEQHAGEALEAIKKPFNRIANPNGLHDSTADGSHKRSKNSDSEETKSEPPETTAPLPSTTKSTTPPTQNILRKLTSSAQS